MIENSQIEKELRAVSINSSAERELDGYGREFNIDIFNALTKAVAQIAAHINRPDIADELLNARDAAAAGYMLKADSTTLDRDDSLRHNAGMSEEEWAEIETTSDGEHPG